MEAPAMGTSFDEVCAASLQRHFSILEMVLQGLKKSHPQSDQLESELQTLSDEVTTKMNGFLVRQTEMSRKPRSAEYFAERWDYLLWDTYKVKCNVNEEFPFLFPEYKDSFAGPAAPEHLRILEPPARRDSAEQIVIQPSISPALVLPPRIGAAAQKAPAHGISIIRPVREDLPQSLQDRVLPLKVRQEIWEQYFQGCERQDGAEPLQLQIPRSKRNLLLGGDTMANGEGKSRVTFEDLRFVLPADVNVIFQDSPDHRFGFTLLYIGLDSTWLDDPHARGAIAALQTAWETLLLWANLVNDGYNINIVEWARLHTRNEIGMMRERLLDTNNNMAKAIDYVEKEGIHRDPLPAMSHTAAPLPCRPKESQHQATISAERKAENEKLSAMMAAAAQTQRAEVVTRVANIIDGTRMDPAGTALDWKALKTKLSHFVVETGDAASRATWVHEGCTAWREANLPESMEQQAMFDRELVSWYSGFLSFLGSWK